jgi:hypothetical protein
VVNDFSQSEQVLFSLFFLIKSSREDDLSRGACVLVLPCASSKYLIHVKNEKCENLQQEIKANVT